MHVFSLLASFVLSSIAQCQAAEWELIAVGHWQCREGLMGCVYNGFSIDESNGNFYMIAGYFDLHDLWLSKDLGLHWTQARNDVFGCEQTSCGRCDFWFGH